MFVHPGFDPVAFHLGPWPIRWYGLMYLAAFAQLLLLGKYRIRQSIYSNWQMRDLDDLLLYGILGVIIGGRLGYVLFYQPAYYFSHPGKIFILWEGGMSFHGGFIGVLIGIGIYALRNKKSWLAITDFIAPLTPLGFAVGRLGNFINGELWGRPTDAPWAMVFPMVDNLPRHPSQLYQCALEGVLLFILLWWYSAKTRPRGAVSGLFLIGYGGFRFIIEYFREPDSFLGFLALGWTMGQWLSVPMMLIGLLLLISAYWRDPLSPNADTSLR